MLGFAHCGLQSASMRQPAQRRSSQAPRKRGARQCSVVRAARDADATNARGQHCAREVSRRNALGAMASAAMAAAAMGAAGAVSAADKTKLKFATLDSGVAIATVKAGSGNSPRNGDLVIVDYVGYLSNGTIFDNTKSPGRKPLAFQMGQRKIIPGLEDALRTMKPGGEATVVVPPKLAYGERGVCFEGQGCLIPPNETLEYDLTLIRVAVSPI
uniref:peptidylprolyl isomerase n=1 Tax=Erythrolobus australicus TaxID=1077150 RepID=A0A7S1TMZ1_9RHOD|mmetsp:Transcript_2936/g.8072  ORF Transcript_2936/g.8072 Transcript_2936/m.8072 type:complete len:214 (+) Transcript_2936:89-730(+)